MASIPLISVVVPHAGRVEDLRQCVASLRAQTLDAGSYEVLVVDDGGWLSVAETVALSGPLVRVIAKPHTGVCGTRNLGIRSSRADLVVLLDDDCLAAADLLESYIRFMSERPEIAGAGGAVLSRDGGDIFAAYARCRGLLSGPVMVGETLQTIITANACFRRVALERVGLFAAYLDQHFGSCGGEDTDLSFMLRQSEAVLASCPGAVAFHRHRSGLSAFATQQARIGEGLVVHAKARGLPMSEFGLPEPDLGDVVIHMFRFLVMDSAASGPSLLARVRRYWADPSLSWREKATFPAIDVLRRCCYIFGILRGAWRLGRAGGPVGWGRR